MDKVALLEAVARRWNGDGIPYSVAHGVEAYPHRVGRDVDVMAGRGRARQLIEVAQHVLESHGLAVARPPRLWGERLLAASLDSDVDVLEIHAVEEITWRVAVLADELQPCLQVGPFALDPWVRFAKRILLPALAAPLSKLMTEVDRYPLEEAETATARVRLPILLGPRLAESFERALSGRDPSSFAVLVPLMRRAVTRRTWTRRPASAVRQLARIILRRAAQPFSPCGPIVSLVGPAGAGKTALQAALCVGDSLVFTRRIALRWASAHEPAASWLRHWLRIAGYLARGARRAVDDLLRSSRQQLVIYEGCGLDLVVSPRRFGLRSGAGAWLCWRLLPRPDLIVLLDASGRPESRTEDVAREYSAWRSLLPATNNAVVVRADRATEELKNEVISLIVRAFVSKSGTAPLRP